MKGNTEVKRPENEADNFRVSRHRGSVANGFSSKRLLSTVLMAAESGF